MPRSATQLDAGKRGMPMNFNHEELMLMMLYNTGTRLGLIHELRLMQCYLMPDETALRELSEGVIGEAETADRRRVCRTGISARLNFAACGRHTYSLLQCHLVWYTELDNSEFERSVFNGKQESRNVC